MCYSTTFLFVRARLFLPFDYTFITLLTLLNLSRYNTAPHSQSILSLIYNQIQMNTNILSTAGGRVVAGSNPVTPTNHKALIIVRLSMLFSFRTLQNYHTVQT